MLSSTTVSLFSLGEYFVKVYSLLKYKTLIITILYTPVLNSENNDFLKTNKDSLEFVFEQNSILIWANREILQIICYPFCLCWIWYPNCL